MHSWLGIKYGRLTAREIIVEANIIIPFFPHLLYCLSKEDNTIFQTTSSAYNDSRSSNKSDLLVLLPWRKEGNTKVEGSRKRRPSV